MPPASPDAPLYEIKANLFKALAHPARVRILEILVAANGCDDDTADRAGAQPGVTVIELATASTRRRGFSIGGSSGSVIRHCIWPS